MGIDLSGWNQFAQNLGNIGAQMRAPDILAGLTGGAPQQSGGFLSSLLGGQDQTGLNSQVQQPQMLPQSLPQPQQSGFLGNILNGGQQPQVNPAVAPQVTQAEQANRIAPADQTVGGDIHHQIAQFAYDYATKRGVDPNLALGIADSEGLNRANPLAANSDPSHSGQPGTSVGPFQMRTPGLGSQYGINADTPWQTQVTNAIDYMATHNQDQITGTWSSVRDQGGWDKITAKGAQAARNYGVNTGGGAPQTANMQLAGPVPTPNAIPPGVMSAQGGSPAWQGGQPQTAQGGVQAWQGAAPITAQGGSPPISPTQLAGPVPTPNAPGAQGPAITVPGYESAGPVTRAQALAAPDNDPKMPAVEDWDAAAAKGVPAVNMGAPPRAPQQLAAAPQMAAQAPAMAQQAPQRAPLDMTPAAGSTGPSGVPTVGSGATQTPMGQQFQPSPAAINAALNNPYTKLWGQQALQQYMQRQQMQQQLQKEQIMAVFNNQLQQGNATIQKVPVNDASGATVGMQSAYVYRDPRNPNAAPHIMPFGPVDTNAVKDNQPAAIKEFEYGQKHQDFARAPKWVPNASTDALGQPVGGWVSPPNPGQPQQQGQVQGAQQAAGGTASNTAVVGGKQIDMSQPDWFDQLPLTYQQAVKNYVGGQTMPTGRGGFVQEIKLLAQKYGNDIGMPADDTTFNARKAMRNSLSVTTPNSLGGQIQFLNTGIGHLQTMSNNALALNNSDGWGFAPLANAINSARGLTTDQQSAIGKIKDSAVRYGQELTKFYAGSPGGEAERQAFLSAVDGAKSPKELASVIENEAELIPSRGMGLQGQIDQGLGPLAAQYQVFRPESKTALEKISNNIGTLRGQNQGPGGLFPSIAAVPGQSQATQPQQPQQAAPAMRMPIPMSAASALKAQPQRRQEFDQKYGSPSLPRPSDQVLGPMQ